jgi:hypothetical protein
LLPLLFTVEERFAKQVTGQDPLALSGQLGSVCEFDSQFSINAKADARRISFGMAASGHSLFPDEGCGCLLANQLLQIGLLVAGERLQTDCLQRKAIIIFALFAVFCEFVCMVKKSPVGHQVCFVKKHFCSSLKWPILLLFCSRRSRVIWEAKRSWYVCWLSSAANVLRAKNEAQVVQPGYEARRVGLS